PRGRLVRRLHAPVEHRRLDGLPAGGDPDAERARPGSRRRDVPGPDLARVHGGRTLEPARCRLHHAEQLPGVPAVAPGLLRAVPVVLLDAADLRDAEQVTLAPRAARATVRRAPRARPALGTPPIPTRRSPGEAGRRPRGG